jgi:hypothetical protein
MGMQIDESVRASDGAQHNLAILVIAEKVLERRMAERIRFDGKNAGATSQKHFGRLSEICTNIKAQSTGREK